MTVPTTAAGQLYAARAFVRGSASNVGDTIILTVREWKNGNVVDTASTTTSLTTTKFTKLLTTYTAKADGSQLDVFVWRGASISSNEHFFVDAITLTPAELISSDTAWDSDPLSFWGAIDCEESSRHALISSGGDPMLSATGAAQANASYRRLTVLDGDNVSGERCELGQNDHYEGPTAQYRQGERIVTTLSVRLPNNFLTSGGSWQNVFQIKQSQPSDGDTAGTPMIGMHVVNNEWRLHGLSEGPIWSASVTKNQWTRFVIDGLYTQDAEDGWLKIYADLNADKDFLDAGEHGEESELATLATEAEPVEEDDGLPAGSPIPGHLRAGIYHCAAAPVEENPCPKGADPWPCPAPPLGSGCAIDIDNVQIARLRN